MKVLSTFFASIVFASMNVLADSSTIAESSTGTSALTKGTTIPAVSMTSVNGDQVDLSNFSKTPTIAIFYRGGWCPYCNRHLSAIQGIKDELREMGYQIVAISPDKVDELKRTSEGQQLDYQLLSDSKGDAARAFGIAFDAAKEYKPKYGERVVGMLENASGETHHQLPVPSVFILKNGKVEYSYSNPDYTVRLSADELLEAAKANR
ncbi:redoxin domain-containing protein [Porticoccaceae bacterium LTM1]|nr:redoxin domain-containing protein [Porticoccaceae bacterium LTM1]